MINADMREYDYYTYGTKDTYGEDTISYSTSAGKVKMAIYTTNQYIQDNINYKGAQYIGLTHNNIDDTYVIAYGSKKLKVLYVNNKGSFNQVYMCEI